MERTNRIILLFGKKGCGKSYRSRELSLEWDRRIIVDPMREYSRGTVVYNLPDLVDYVGRLRHGRFSVVLRTMAKDEELAAARLAVAGDPLDPPLPDSLVYLDEVDRLCTPQHIPEEIHSIANYGRHFRVSLIANARRPKRIHHDLTANADEIHIGQLLEPADADYLREFIGEELTERAKHLNRPGDFVVWTNDGLTRGPDSEQSATSKARARKQEAERPGGAGDSARPGERGMARRAGVGLGESPGEDADQES